MKNLIKNNTLKKASIPLLFTLVFFVMFFVYSKYITTIDKTITINVRKPNYTVVFHSNDENDNTFSQNFTYGTPQTLTPNSFQNPGYSFHKWSLTTDGTGTSFHDEEEVDKLSSQDDSTVNLYAQWTPNTDTCPENNICYFGNGDDGYGDMANQPVSSNTDVMLIPSNFSRPGYGFVGWNTSADGTGTNLGPSQTYHVDDLSSGGLKLYAKWIPSTGNLQNWKGCDNLNKGDIVALTDTRDNNTYAVIKYTEDQCWMMENLRLDLSSSDLEISGINTNNPTHNFSTTVNESHPSSSNTFCETNNSSCIDKILYNTNNTNRSLTASYSTNDAASSWYSYGNYYNWYTATAGHGTFSISSPGTAVEGDLCPAGWKLPTGYGNASDFPKLDIAMGGNGKDRNTETTGPVASALYRSYPYNFIYSGEQRGNKGNNRNISGGYVASDVVSSSRAVNLWVRGEGVNMNTNSTPKVRGQTIRCVINEGYIEIGNIHYDANGGTGTMADVTNVDLGNAVAANNEFTKDHATFLNWNTSPNGNGVVVTEGGSVSTAASHMGISEGDTLTLYAIWRSDYSLVYNGNGESAGVMTSVNSSSISAGNFRFTTPNYSRTGYGFAGWSLDPDASTKIINNEPVTIYGPNEQITIDNTFLSHADEDCKITIYAVWLAPTKTMQSFTASDCGAMNVGDVTALEDTRDNNVYTVAKLGDSHCWMTENLRLIPTYATFTSDNTNSPTADFIAEAPTVYTVANTCIDDDASCIDKIFFNSSAINRGFDPKYNGTTSNSSWYGYGVMYNWYAATAGNGKFETSSGNASGDICPSGWRLPTGGEFGEYVTLNEMINNESLTTDKGLVRFPANFIYSGDYNYYKPNGRGQYGRFWTSTANGNNNAHRLGIISSGPTPTGSWNKWVAFAVRCIVK